MDAHGWRGVCGPDGGDRLPHPAPFVVRDAWAQVSTALTEHFSPEDLAQRKQTYRRGRNGRGA